MSDGFHWRFNVHVLGSVLLTRRLNVSWTGSGHRNRIRLHWLWLLLYWSRNRRWGLFWYLFGLHWLQDLLEEDKEVLIRQI